MTELQKLTHYKSQNGELAEYPGLPDNVRETLLALSGFLRTLVVDLECDGVDDIAIASNAAVATEEANTRCREIADLLGIKRRGPEYDLLYEAITLGWNAGVASQKLFMDQRERIQKAIRREQQQRAGAAKSRKGVTKEQIERLVAEKMEDNQHLSLTDARRQAAEDLGISERTMFRRLKSE